MSNFRKRSVQKPLPGTRTSAQTGQVITSSGNPSLDLILGGGLPIGSICLIEEDKYLTNSRVLAKYFLAEGFLCDHTIFLGSLDENPNELLRRLPRPLDDQEIEKEQADELEACGDGTPKNGLRIAWRYENLPLVNSEQATAKIGHHFNLMEYMGPIYLDHIETVTWGECKANKMDSSEEQDTTAEDVQQMDLNVSKPSSTDAVAGNSPQLSDDINMQGDTIMSSIGDGDGDDDVGNGSIGMVDVDVSNTIITTTNNIEMDVPKSEETTTSEESTTTTTGDAAETAAANDKPKIFHSSKFQELWTVLHTLLLERKFNETALLHKCLCRVCITSLGSPLWHDEGFSHDILKFLTLLRSTVRSQTSVCFLTIPMHLVAKYDPNLVGQIRNLVDYAIELESFVGLSQPVHPALREYNGLLHIHKMTAINTLTAYMPETRDLAFKLRRKKFIIEKIHLPPELQENNNDENVSGAAATAAIVPTLSCSGSNIQANPKASLDF